MINEQELMSIIASLRVHSASKGKRSPHKPFLILVALARIQQGKGRKVLFSEIEGLLDELLTEFLPQKSTALPEQPFCRLRGDEIWELSSPSDRSLPSGVLLKTRLRDEKVEGGFNLEVYNLLNGDAMLVEKVASYLLNKNFPTTIHQDILDMVGLNLSVNRALGIADEKGRARDQNFRSNILQIYDFRCAVCGFDVRLNQHSIALEAAHIKWFAADGPNIESNGLALCSLHHKLFDRGAFSVSEQYEIVVSDKVGGCTGLKEWLLDFHNRKLIMPSERCNMPNKEFTEWHRDEVFHVDS